jgi:polyhydroxyalkanoate synthesis regulator phasin
MKQEREKILDMVEEGKITADEAVRLLEALRPRHHHWEWEWDQEEIDAKLQRLSGAAKDIGDKMGAAFKEVEPKMRQATRRVVEKTVDVVDDLSRMLNDYLKNLETEEKHEDKQPPQDGPRPN